MNNFGDIEAMKVVYFWKCTKKFQKMLMVLKIIAFELVPGVSVKYDCNTCDGTSTC